MATKIITYNVNGIRAAVKKGFLEWLDATDADLVCLQEIKADFDQAPITELKALGYEVYWHAAPKKGYSGVAVLSKIAPQHIEVGFGDYPLTDEEGRVLRLDFADFSLVSVYMPSGSSGELRQGFKMEWVANFYAYVQQHLLPRYPNLIISGDYNICHQPIDIHNPKSNAKSSGFLPEERAWLGEFMELGFIDTFRHLNKEPHQYTWWSTRFGARDRNLGWRIDYQMISHPMESRLQRALILTEARHSDHAPVMIEIA